MTTSPTPTRPTAVTIVVVLTWIAGLLDVVGGVLLIAFHGNDSFVADANTSGANLLVLGIFLILIGLFIILLAGAIGRGNRGARLILTFIMLIRLALGFGGLLTSHGAARVDSAFEFVTAIVVLALLWSTQARSFFALK